MRRVTLREVAEASGVHLSTVSRILRGDVARVRPDTVERVRAQARAMGYKVDRWAASLRSGHTHIVGMLVPRITDVVLASVFESFESEASDHGYLAVVAGTWDTEARRAAALARFVEQRVDGVVVADAHIDDEALHAFAAEGPPVLLASRRSGELPSVTGDDYDGGRQAGRHIASLGARRVTVLGGPMFASTSKDRVAGFVDAYREAATDGDVEVERAGFDLPSGLRAMERVLDRGERVPEAVFVVNDFAAIGAISALSRRGIVPGRDIAVVGYNDIPISAELPIPLSSVRADLDAMGRAAFQGIRALIAGAPREDIRVRSELIVRDSSRVSFPAAEPANR